ncbi:hypothetical protein EJ06DRAFT_216063 [Trichodelitschia bisporula]|uniref:Uncharacterized protein n=1 Tax=Trichodelitschia bisporula TaxID=703511 RepID=A0A6G1I8R5_9PEZI|nr:hypothetical protein EJ06DRAFT_216063 [Trichodelitschia bisporula]
MVPPPPLSAGSSPAHRQPLATGAFGSAASSPAAGRARHVGARHWCAWTRRQVPAIPRYRAHTPLAARPSVAASPALRTQAHSAVPSGLSHGPAGPVSSGLCLPVSALRVLPTLYAPPINVSLDRYCTAASGPRARSRASRRPCPKRGVYVKRGCGQWGRRASSV